jgi:hypothetical protein
LNRSFSPFHKIMTRTHSSNLIGVDFPKLNLTSPIWSSYTIYTSSHRSILLG